jgi:opacity protein-like surface antigen
MKTRRFLSRSRRSSVRAALCWLTLATPAFAGEYQPPAEHFPASGFFIGLGGSYNSTKFSQDLYASGISDIFSGSTLVAFGEAGGPSSPFRETESSFAPEVQLGFFRNFADHEWLWGAKFRYKYVDLTSDDSLIDSPQSGSFTNTGAAPSGSSFTGNVIIESSHTKIEQEFSLLAFVGQPFGRGTVYFGAGPVLFGARSNLYGATGFAALDGAHFDITGMPSNFSSSDWVWGGAAQIGMTYQLDETWFLDLNYTYAVSREFSHDYSTPFASAADGYTDSGTLFINTSQRVNSQAFAISINKLF